MEHTGADGSRDGFFEDGPFSFLQSTIFSVLVSCLEFISTATLLSYICLDVVRDPSLGLWTSIAWITMVLLLAFLPIVSSSLISALIPMSLGPAKTHLLEQDHAYWIRREGIKHLIQNTTNREEIVLFGLAEWIASKWSAVNHLQKRRQDDSRISEWKGALQGLVRESGQVVFYVSAWHSNRLLIMG